MVRHLRTDIQLKVLTVAGTRPELIRLSRVLPKLDESCEHTFVWTGQNYTDSLSTIFFEDLGIRAPDYWQHKRSTGLAEQLANTFSIVECAVNAESPDRALVLGDTNSALSSIILERMGVPVYHMEAGNRCLDWKVPEEKNRRVIDAISSVNMPYTQISMDNLLREGVSRDSIYVTGNPIWEVMQHYRGRVEGSAILETLGLERNKYFLATFHRQENVDDRGRLEQILIGLRQVARQHPVVCSIHPRTRSKIDEFGLDHDGLVFCEPFGFFDFVHLESMALGVLTDSGTVQEECCLLGVPTVTMRDTTERPETVICGSNIVSGLRGARIKSLMDVMQTKRLWDFPEGYKDELVSEKVVTKLLGEI